ncbi:MAG: TMEM165/GDT1 family protein [Firmicutes bacterium]|nr:TMEM165/GDT1 family protein [Bacillota bacterium]
MSALSVAGVVFAVIFVAELPDKTSLTSLTLATRQPPAWVWLGAALAFLVHTALAVAAGSALALVPPLAVRMVSGLAFLAFGALMWWRGEGGRGEAAAGERVRGERAFGRVVLEAAALVFVAEFGDLTQFAIAALAARLHHPLVVGAAAWAGLVAAAFVAVVVGGRLGAWAGGQRLQRVAAVVLAALGTSVLLGFNVGGI